MSNDNQAEFTASQHVLSAAISLTRQHSKFTYYLACFLISSSIRQYYFTWYAYFRTVDDIADTDNKSLKQKKIYLADQILAVDILYAGNDNYKSKKNIETEFLSHLIMWDKNNNKSRLRQPILDLLLCIKYDVSRTGDTPDKEELEDYIRREVTSYIVTLHNFCCPSEEFYNFEIIKAGIAGKWSHILRDLLLDLRQGIINISRQDIIGYNLDLAMISSKPEDVFLRQWVKSIVTVAEKNFAEGKRSLSHENCLSYKIAISLLCSKYETYLRRIKRKNYVLSAESEITSFNKVLNILNTALDLSKLLLSHLRQKF